MKASLIPYSNKMNRIKPLIKTLKSDIVLRSIFILGGSIILDWVFLIHSIIYRSITAWEVGKVWFIFQIVWYLLLIAARIVLVLYYALKRVGKKNLNDSKTNLTLLFSILMFLIGITIGILSNILFTLGKELKIGTYFFVLNAIYVVIKLILAALGRKHFSDNDEDMFFYRYKVRFSTIESLFQLVLIFYKSISYLNISLQFYSNMVFSVGVSVALIVLISSIYIPIKEKRRISKTQV